MSHSPVPFQDRTPNPSLQMMTWAEAQQPLLEGKTVTRLGWSSPDEYAQVRDKWLSIHTKGEWHTWNIHIADMSATDWVLLSDLQVD